MFSPLQISSSPWLSEPSIHLCVIMTIYEYSSGVSLQPRYLFYISEPNNQLPLWSFLLNVSQHFNMNMPQTLDVHPKSPFSPYSRWHLKPVSHLWFFSLLDSPIQSTSTIHLESTTAPTQSVVTFFLMSITLHLYLYNSPPSIPVSFYSSILCP